MQRFLIVTLVGLNFILNLNRYRNDYEPITTAERIESFGYINETHNVITKDGYILTIFRIKSSIKPVDTTQKPRPVVLLMHGFASSSDTWILPGSRDALAFNLADQNYDVWLGNARGTPYGSRHLSLKTSDRNFWKFSWHEMGIIDLPTIIDYILAETDQTSLHYVGHSQGATVLFVLLSSQPKYNLKLKTSHLLAPVAYMQNAKAWYLYAGKPFVTFYNIFDLLLGDFPFLQNRILLKILGFDWCRSHRASVKFCSFVIFATYGGYSQHLNTHLLPEFFRTHPAGCSTNQANHMIQLFVSGHFRQFDFGSKRNMQRYNRTSPPDYEVANINPRFPLNIYYSEHDYLASKKDVEKFSLLLGNKSRNHLIDLNYFAHIDFLLAFNVKEVINNDVIRKMDQAELLLQQEEEDQKDSK